MHNKRLSLLIPKHQNKTSKEIAEMYSTQSSKLPRTSVQASKNTGKKEIVEPLNKNSLTKTLKSFNSPVFQDTKPQKPSQVIIKNSPYEITLEILEHNAKTAELRESFSIAEEKILKQIKGTHQESEKFSSKLSHSVIVENFKEDALNIDKKISGFTEENRILKEKLALATLEEIDERLRREKPSDRYIEKYSGKLLDTESDAQISDLLQKIKHFASPEECTESILGFGSKISEKNFPSFITQLCQVISNDRKTLKKQEIDNRRLLRLKQEVVYRLQQSINKITSKKLNYY